jgi:HSPB1-associated protein 1
MNQLFSDDKQKEIIDSVKWSEIGLDSNLDTNGKNSTLWIGTEGAFTPCHQDTYGYNFVAQITGKYVILR